MERRLSAVFAADMVGYSRLMEADEVGTLERQKAHRKEFINPTFETFHGRIVKEMGDGLLVEFPSVVEAVQCAVTIQRAMPQREAGVPEDRRITYRIGINLGDIIVEGDDIHGDGVNVAARLEQMAEPGGICISGAAYDQLRSTVEVGYESLGDVQVKNIERPIRAYRVLTETADAGTLIEKPKRRMGPGIWAAVAAVLLLAIGAGGWWAQQPDFEPADPEKFALEVPDKPSIAVLPFDNLSGDPADDYLGDSLTENIIAELSTIPNLLVIARNSVFTFKGKPVQVQEVAETLGVRYVLEGSVQRQGDQMRVVTQLVDALTGNHLWAERYDYSVDRIFDVQDDITEKLTEEMEVKLTLGEQARAWREAFGSPDDYRLFMQGRAAINQLNPESHKTAERLFNELHRRNPDNPSALRLMAWLQSHKYVWGLGPTLEPAEHRKLARQYAEKFQALLGEHQTVDLHNLLAWLDFFDGQYDSAVAHVDEAVKLAPSQADAHSIGGFIKVYSAQPAEGVELLRLAMRLEPLHPPWISVSTGHGLARLGKYDEAESVFLEVLPKTGGGVDTWASLSSLAAVLVFQGKELEAKEYGERMLKLRPDFTIDQARQFGDKDRAYIERRLDALRKAGIPEHAPPKLPDKPSIAVLPFDNMSDDQTQQFFVDGMVEDLITDLSKVPGLFVIARNSSFAYRDRPVDVKQVARDLGVQHVLEGSVRRAGNRVRINAQLIDGLSNSHVWAERYDGQLDDVFDVQDQITGEIVEALQLQLSPQQQQKISSAKTEDSAAYDLFLKGRESRHRLTPEAYKAAIGYLLEAVELDADYAQAHAELAFLYWDARYRGWLPAIGVEGDQEMFRRATHHLDLAFRDPSPLAYATRGFMIGIIERDADRALIVSRRAIEIDPNFSEGHVFVADRAAIAGQTDEALRLLEDARRLDPDLPPGFHFAKGLAHYVQEDYVAARVSLEKALARRTDDVYAQQLLIAVYGHIGETENAANLLASYNQSYQNRGFDSMVASSAYLWPFMDTDENDRLYEDFKKAGVPDPAPAFDNGAVARELTAEEAWTLQTPSVATGVMVTPTGVKIPFSWKWESDGRIEFSISGQVYKLQYHRTGDVLWSEMGKIRVFRLTDAEAQKWSHPFVSFQPSTSSYFYFTLTK